MLTLVLVLMVSVTAAFAQYITAFALPENDLAPGLSTARAMGMGPTGVAVADGPGALNWNPALLADGAVPVGYMENPWTWSLEGTAEVAGELDYWGVHLLGQSAENGVGLGFSYQSTDTDFIGDYWMAGVGFPLDDNGWAAGVSFFDAEDEFDDSIWTIGLAGPVPVSPEQVLLVGLTVEDVLGDIEGDGVDTPFFNLGLGLPVMAEEGGILVAVDWLDITDEYDSVVNFGVEYDSMNCWQLRGGLYDGDMFGFGLGWDTGQWNVDAAWQEAGDSEADDSIVISAGTTW
jgi:hypothetical protein